MLIELFIVFMIIAVLLTVGVGAYIGFRDRAADAAAEANLRAIIPSIEAYYADRRTYDAMTLDVLKASYDQALKQCATRSRAPQRTRTASPARTPARRGARRAPAELVATGALADQRAAMTNGRLIPARYPRPA